MEIKVNISLKDVGQRMVLLEELAEAVDRLDTDHYLTDALDNQDNWAAEIWREIERVLGELKGE